MGVIKKIAAALVMVISALLLLAFLAGIAGVWIVRGDAIQLVNDVANLADRSVQRARNAVTLVQTDIGERQGKLDAAVTNIEAAGDKVQETNVALAAAEQLLDKDLNPTVQRVSQQLGDISDTVAFIDDTVTMMQRLTFTKQSKMLDLVDNIIESVKQVSQNVQELSQNVQSVKVKATANAVQALSAPLKRASNLLGNVNDDLAQLDSRLSDTQAKVRVLRGQVTTGITLVAIVLTLAFLWIALANLGLLVHAWGIYTGRDPLARWHRARQEA